MRINKILSVISIVFAFIVLVPFTARAEEETKRFETISGYEELIKNGPVSEEETETNALLSLAMKLVSDGLKEMFRRLPACFVIAFLSWGLKLLSPQKNGSLIRISVEMCSSLYIFGVMIPQMVLCVEALTGIKDELGGTLTSSVGVILFCADAQGYAGTSAIISGLFSTELSLFLFVIEHALVPLLSLFVCAGIASCITDGKILRRFSCAVKRICVGILTVGATVFSSALFISVRANASSGGILRRTAATALSRSIPVVGNIFGKNLESVSLCLNGVIGKAGVYAIGVTAYDLLPVLVTTVCEMLFLCVCDCLFSVAGNERLCHMIETYQDAVSILFAVLCTYAVSAVVGFGVLMEIGS